MLECAKKSLVIGVIVLKRFIYKVLSVLFIMSVLVNVAFAAGAETVKQNIIRQAKAMGVEPAIVLSIAKTESGFNQNARSAHGHIGVFQLSQGAAKHLGVNPYNTDDNIKGGITYYKNLYSRFGKMELAVAAYNLGPEAVRRANNTVPKSAQPFVNRIMADYKIYKNTVK